MIDISALFRKKKKTFVIQIYEVHPSDPSRSWTNPFTREVVTYTKEEAYETAQAVVTARNKKREINNVEWHEWVVGEIWVKGKEK